ncbi:lysozyme-like [Ctenocephalides felis]|uniref:lysozyme-like n=1 Tax=Ctenocephalides felis TaxID=7515 RepID=UPI000E6E3036|nr:lysozyme-like [Ctenocephalides felis]
MESGVCLVESESAGNTSALGILNGRGKFYHGLFQINEEYWCRKGNPGGGCNVTCESLTDEDISMAAACALKIYNRHGFRQWAGWKVRCEGKSIDLSKCFVETENLMK